MVCRLSTSPVVVCVVVVIRVVLEVGTRTKAHASDLARLVDILPDDIRNFLQRWIIEKVRRRQCRTGARYCMSRVPLHTNALFVVHVCMLFDVSQRTLPSPS